MLIPAQWKVCEVGNVLAASLGVYLASGGMAADNLSDFNIDQMRRIQRLSRSE